jgi:hypothetical protein
LHVDNAERIGLARHLKLELSGSSAEFVGKISESRFSEALQGKKNILFRHRNPA